MRYLRRLRAVRPRPPSAGVVIGTVALMVALGGTAGAALPGINQVFSVDIVDGQVRSADIRNGAVRNADINANAVGQNKMRTDSIGADELKDTQVTGSGLFILAGNAGEVTATCPGNRQIVSGGFNWDLNVAGLYTTSVELDTFNDSVTVKGFNDSTAGRTLSARAQCIAE